MIKDVNFWCVRKFKRFVLVPGIVYFITKEIQISEYTSSIIDVT